MPCSIIFYDADGKVISTTYIDNFQFRNIEDEVKLWAPKRAVRVVFDIALTPGGTDENNRPLLRPKG